MTKRVILPAEATEEMEQAGFAAIEEYEQWKTERKFPRPILVAHIWDSMSAAASGKVTEAELEKAFTKFHDAQHIDGLSEAEAFRAALSVLGLEVE